MQLSLYPFQLQYKFPFRIAHGMRTHTDIVYVKLEHEGHVAWGEAALPPYLPETQRSVIEFLNNFQQSFSFNSVEDWFDKLKGERHNMAAKAALDMALWQLKASRQNTTIRQLLGIENSAPDKPNCFYTIGLGTAEEMKIKIEDGLQNGFKLFKLKLSGAESDSKVIENFISLRPDDDFAVDMNSGYTNAGDAAIFIEYLHTKKCKIIEQPMNKSMLNEMKTLKAQFPSLLYADESCQGLNDLEKIKDGFDGVNIKLMKCGGITEAYQIILKARECGLKTLIGCMSESSVGCTAAAHLAPLVDWVDLDGPYLISNDPFKGMQVKEGSLNLNPVQQVKEF